MPKPPGAMGAEMQKKFLKTIVLQNSASIKSLQETWLQRSSEGQQPDESSETAPPLPEHLDKLIDSPWTKDASRSIDWWLWYIQQEFETAGGTV